MMTWARATFECSHCGAVFSDSADLKDHATRHAGRPDDVVRPADGRPRVAFVCSHCAAVFPNRWGLRAHLLEHGVVAATEYRSPRSSKPRVTPVPVELSRNHRIAPSHDIKLAGQVAGHRHHRRILAKRLALVAAALLVLLIATPFALAWWTASASISAKITTGTWGNHLTFAPGCSQATHYSNSGCPQPVTIASLDKQGNLSCDFGAALLGSTTGWCDVLRVTSTAPAALKVSFKPSGTIAPFVASVGFAADTTGGALNPKQTRSVAVQLVVPKTATPGIYTGTLTVAVVGGSESHTIPLTVTVLAKKPCPLPSPTPSLTFAPGCSQATHYSSSGCPQSVTIASLDKQGNISCDFGAALLGSTTSWSDVFRVTSTAPAVLKVSFTPSGASKPFVASVGFAGDTTGGALNPKQTRSVAVQLVVPAKTSPGTYSGTLTVAVVGGSESHTIPLTVTVLAKKPKQARLFTLCLGLSKVLPSGSSTPPPTPPAVACVQPDGIIALSFGEVPLARTIQFTDVVHMASSAGKTADVTLTLSGPAAKVVQRVGFWGGSKLGVLYKDLTLKVGKTAQVAFQFDVGSTSLLGSQSGTLTLTAKLANGTLQQSELPITLDVVDPSADPSASPSSSPSPSVAPQVTVSPSVTPSGAAVPSPSAAPSMSSSPSVSPRPSTSPGVATPSTSPSPTLVIFVAPISLAAIGLTALRRRKRST